ncbi:MAG: hypothetical protein U9Q30_06235, partial [Campylobacterota bacterium]|nr:hypothetical protein [Campylobacterota bacterium]
MKPNILDIQNNTTIKNKSISSSVKKESSGLSLFDSLLKEAKTDTSAKETTIQNISKNESKDINNSLTSSNNTKSEKEDSSKVILKKVATSLVSIISNQKAE